MKCGYDLAVDDAFCQGCGIPRTQALEAEPAANERSERFVGLRRLSRPLKVSLLLALIVGASLLGASFAFQPRSTSGDYLANLRTQLSQLEGELAELQQDANSLHSKINILNEQIASSQNRVSTLQGQIQESQKQLDSVRSEIASLRQQLSDLQNQLTSARASLSAAQQEVNQIRNSLQEATAKVQQLESKLQQEQATLQSYIANRDQAQSKHDSLLAEYNSRGSTYETRMNTYNQKLEEYNTRWARLKNDILGIAVIAAIAVLLTGGLALSDIPTILTILSGFGIDVESMWKEYNELQQLKTWLQNEEAWLKSEYEQLRVLKAELDRATSDLAHWNEKVQNQQAGVAKTQNDLDYWTSKKTQLTSQLTDAQNKVDQLTAQIRTLESQQAQAQASLDSDLAKEEELKSSIESQQAEVNTLEDLIASRSGERFAAQTALQKCEADIQRARSQANDLSYEINLVVAHPYLRWGGLAIFTGAIAILLVAAVGLATLASSVRAGLGRVRELTSKLRRPRPGPELEIPAEAVEEVPAEIPPKPEPEVRVIPVEPIAPKIEKPRKKRPPAAKPRKRKPADKKRKKAGKSRKPSVKESQVAQTSPLSA